MDRNRICKVKFTSVTWPKNGLPTELDRNIRAVFIFDDEGKMLSKDDLTDIFKAYLQDEFGECPINLDFKCEM